MITTFRIRLQICNHVNGHFFNPAILIFRFFGAAVRAVIIFAAERAQNFTQMSFGQFQSRSISSSNKFNIRTKNVTWSKQIFHIYKSCHYKSLVNFFSIEGYIGIYFSLINELENWVQYLLSYSEA